MVKGNWTATAVAGIVAILLYSCGDDANPVGLPDELQVQGCTDIAATNFSRSATQDNGSCRYDRDKLYAMQLFGVDVDPDIRTVRILLQVRDEDGRGVAGLTASDFVVAENGRKTGVEADLQLDTESLDFTVRTVLLLDISSSVEGLVAQIKEATIALVNDKQPRQVFAIYVFDQDPTLLVDFTDDTETLVSAIESIKEDELFDSTNLFGAIIHVSNRWEDVISTDEVTDGSLVIFTDGFHNADPNLDVQDALAAMQNLSGNPKKIFVAALDSPDLERGPLQQLALSTDGFFETDEVGSLADTFLRIQEEITDGANSIYYLAYTSPITNPETNQEDLEVAIIGNDNTTAEGRILTTFNSDGFGR
jgi:Mg-chelatase subunit ChlD